MKRMIASVLTACTILFATVLPVSASDAHGGTTNGSKLSNAQEKSIKEELANLGVDAPTQEKLIKKLEQGQQWDSLNHEKVEAVKDKLIVSPSHPYARYVFEDGSVIVHSLQIPNAQSTDPTSIHPNLSGGSMSCGTGYCNFSGVNISTSDGAVKANYYVSYTIVNGTLNPDRITSVYNYSITVVGGTYSNASLRNVIPTEVVGSSGYAAQGELSFEWQIVGGLSNGNDRLDVYVGSDTAWEDANW